MTCSKIPWEVGGHGFWSRGTARASPGGGTVISSPVKSTAVIKRSISKKGKNRKTQTSEDTGSSMADFSLDFKGEILEL